MFSQAFSSALLVTFREGLESFLIVGVILAYLRKTGRAWLAKGVYIGIGVSVVTSTVGAYFLFRAMQAEEGGPNQALYEGVGAMVAAVLVAGLLWQTIRAGRRIKDHIENRIDRAAPQQGQVASWRGTAAVALITVFFVTREGLEAVLFLGVQAFSAKVFPMVVGATVGLVAAATIALLWNRFSDRLNIGVVLRVTAVFLGIFLLQLLIYGVHELAESGVIHGSQDFHDATERFGPEGDIGQVLALSLAGAPLLYLVLVRRLRRA